MNISKIQKTLIKNNPGKQGPDIKNKSKPIHPMHQEVERAYRHKFNSDFKHEILPFSTSWWGRWI